MSASDQKFGTGEWRGTVLLGCLEGKKEGNFEREYGFLQRVGDWRLLRSQVWDRGGGKERKKR